MVKRILAVSGIVLMSATVSWCAGYRVIYKFGQLANVPSSGLVVDAAGNGYGTTARGGFKNAGTVYQLSPVTGFHIIYAFSGPDGRQPQGNLVLDSAGNIYGTTATGGAFTKCNSGQGCGAVFKLAPPASGQGPWTETVLYSFSGKDDGESPQAGVVLDPTGNLYGTTEFGGYQGNPTCQGSGPGCGVVFELMPSQSG
jgi:uncharacterized repeat protein (TIGR03803 family)